MKIGGNCSEPGPLVPIERACRVEKPAPANNLRDESKRYAARALVISKPAADSSKARCGTRVIDGEQQLLQPAFVAQVLGQMMGNSPDKVAVARAYARNCPTQTYFRFAETA